MENGIYVIETYGRKTKLIYHYGILVKNGFNDYVLHNSEYNEPNIFGGSLKLESLQDFLSKYESIQCYKTNLTEQEVLSKTEPLLDKKYSNLFFNCNTYAATIAPDFTPFAQEKYFYGLGATTLILYLFKK